MSFDAHKNFAASTVATPPSPATGGLSLTVAAGTGTRFPTPPFNATVCPNNTAPTVNNAEIVRVTGRVGDTFTLQRSQESTSARSIAIGDQIFAGPTAKTVTDIESQITTDERPFDDDVPLINNAADPTKLARFSLAGLSTGVTRVYSMPDQDGTVALVGGGGGFTLGSIPFANNIGELIEDNANLFWDDTNNRLGIGTNAPTAPLTVAGVIAIVTATTPEIQFGDKTATVDRGWWAVGLDQAASVPFRDLFLAKGYTFHISDGVLNTTTTLTSASANFTSAAVGYAAVGTGIPNGTTIASVTNSTTVILSQAATQTASGVTVTFSKAGQNDNDLLYFNHNGFAEPNVGIGYPQPPTAYRVYIKSTSLDLTQGILKLSGLASQTGKMFSIDNPNFADAFYVAADGSVYAQSGAANPLKLYDNASHPILVTSTTTNGANVYRVGINIVPTSNTGTLHVFGSSSGQNANSNANGIVTETSGNNGITVLAGATSTGALYFGSSVSATRGGVRYNHSTDQLQFLASASVRMTVDGTGTVGIGTTGVPPTELTVNSTQTTDPRGIMSAQYTTDTLGASIQFRKARGTEGSPTTVVSGDTLGRLAFWGYDGTSYLKMGAIDTVSTGTIATNRVPTQLKFFTATDAAPSVLTNTLTVDSFGIDLGTSLNKTYVVAPSGGDFTTLAACISALDGKFWSSKQVVTIQINDGTYTASSPINFANLHAKWFSIQGQNTYTKSLTSIQSSSGSAGAWSIVLNVNSVTNIAVNDYVGIHTSSGGTLPTYIEGCWQVTNVDAVNTRITVSTTHRNATAPSGAVTATVVVFKTILKFTASDALRIWTMTGLILDNIAIVGDGSANTGVSVEDLSRLYINTIVGINGFGQDNFLMLYHSQCNGGILLSSGATQNGFDIAGSSDLSLSRIVATGNGSDGILATQGSSVTVTAGVASGNASMGMRAVAGSAIIPSNMFTTGNSQDGARTTDIQSYIDLSSLTNTTNVRKGVRASTDSGFFVGSQEAPKSFLFAQASPFEQLNIGSSGQTGGWQGQINLKVSYQGNALINALTLTANTDGTTTSATFPNTVAIGTTTTATRLDVFNTYTSSSQFEGFSVDWQTTANVASVGTRTAATGTGRELFLCSQADSGANSYAAVRINRNSGAAGPVRIGLYNAAGSVASSGTANIKATVIGEYTSSASSGISIGVAVLPAYAQTSTAGATDLLVNRDQSGGVGSGVQLLQDWQVGGVTKMRVSNLGVLDVFNTYTSETNYEKFAVDWQTQANLLIVGARTAATGTARYCIFAAQGVNGSNAYAGIACNRGAGVTIGSFSVFVAAGNLGSDATFGTTSGNSGLFGVSGTNTSTSGPIASVIIAPTYNQSGSTAANTDLLINRTETSLGSGAQLLIDAQVASVSKFSVTNTGGITASVIGVNRFVTNTGATSSGTANTSQKISKAITAIANNTATDVFTVTIPNAAHAASIRITLSGSLGAGGAIGANEATGSICYNIAVTRTAGLDTKINFSTAFGSAAINVTGGATITITAAASAVSGLSSAQQTFTIQVTIARGSGSSTNHTCLARAEVMNANASGVTVG